MPAAPCPSALLYSNFGQNFFKPSPTNSVEMRLGSTEKISKDSPQQQTSSGWFVDSATTDILLGGSKIPWCRKACLAQCPSPYTRPACPPLGLTRPASTWNLSSRKVLWVLNLIHKLLTKGKSLPCFGS